MFYSNLKAKQNMHFPFAANWKFFKRCQDQVPYWKHKSVHHFADALMSDDQKWSGEHYSTV